MITRRKDLRRPDVFTPRLLPSAMFLLPLSPLQLLAADFEVETPTPLPCDPVAWRLFRYRENPELAPSSSAVRLLTRVVA